jgi:hypothetical protein
MLLKAIIDDQELSLEIPERLLREGQIFFDKLDADMDQGWQMSREWVARPNQVERCQIVADKLLTALEKENERLGMLMAGYLLSRMPGLASVTLDTHGEMQNTLFQVVEGASAMPAAASDPISTPASVSAGGDAAPGVDDVPFLPNPAPMGLDKFQAMEQAGNDITPVFKVGKGYRFSVYDHGSGQGVDAPLVAKEADAERLRQAAFKARFESLQLSPR